MPFLNSTSADKVVDMDARKAKNMNENMCCEGHQCMQDILGVEKAKRSSTAAADDEGNTFQVVF